MKTGFPEKENFRKACVNRHRHRKSRELKSFYIKSARLTKNHRFSPKLQKPIKITPRDIWNRKIKTLCLDHS